MNVALTTALLLAAATPPAEDAKSNHQLRALLQQLTSESETDNDAPEAAAPAWKPKKKATVAKQADVKQTDATPKQAKSKKTFATASSMPVGSVAAFFVFGLAAALALVIWSRRRESIDARPLRRIASEAIGRNQQIVLVEALGEYLLVATSGRETALIAQLDAKQAAERIEALQGKNEPTKTTTAFGFLSRFKRQSAFERILNEEQEAQPYSADSETNTKERPSLSAHTALQQYAATASNGAVGRAEPAAPRMSLRPIEGAKRADAIRRRLKAL